jgi:hypothetical protein
MCIYIYIYIMHNWGLQQWYDWVSGDIFFDGHQVGALRPIFGMVTHPRIGILTMGTSQSL